MDSRLRNIENGSYHDRRRELRRRKSTDEDLSDRKSNTTGRTRIASSSDDHFERTEKRSTFYDDDYDVDYDDNDDEILSSSKTRHSLRDEDDPRRSVTRRASRRTNIEVSESERQPSLDSRGSTLKRDTENDSGRISSRSMRNNPTDVEELRGRREERRTQDQSNNARRRIISSLKREEEDSLDKVERRSSIQGKSSRRSSIERDTNTNCKGLSAREMSRTKEKEEEVEEVKDEDIDDDRTSTRNKKEPSVDRDSRISRASESIRIKERKTNVEDGDGTFKGSKEMVNALKRNSTTNKRSTIELPADEWSCEHCTFINKVTERVCVICCKTRSCALPSIETDDTVDPSIEEDVRLIDNGNYERDASISNVDDPNHDLERKTNLLKISNSEESGDGGSTKNKGRTGRKISFSFGTKWSK